MTKVAELDERLASEALRRIAADLSMITDRALSFEKIEVERRTTRAAGKGSVHISFKLSIQRGNGTLHGAFLLPLSAAIELASRLLMMSEEVVAANRALTTLDAQTKDALMEIGNFVGGACESAVRALGFADVKVRSEGCQGVRADVRPAFVYVEGSPLVTARVIGSSGGLPFEALLLLPALD